MYLTKFFNNLLKYKLAWYAFKLSEPQLIIDSLFSLILDTLKIMPLILNINISANFQVKYNFNPRANGAKRRARVLIPHGYLHPGKGKHREVWSSSNVAGAWLKGEWVVITDLKNMADYIAPVHYNISYFCKKIWPLLQPTNGGHFWSQEYGGLSGVANT